MRNITRQFYVLQIGHRIKTAQHAYSEIITVLIGAWSISINFTFAAREVSQRLAKILDIFDTRDFAHSKSPLTHRKFNIFIHPSEGTLNAPSCVFRARHWSRWTIIHAWVGGKNNRHVLRKYLWGGIERLNYF